MAKHTFYIHTVSGDIATLDAWRSDYDRTDVESWHGKPAEECDPENWIEDGKLEAIDLVIGYVVIGNLAIGNAKGWFGDAEGWFGDAEGWSGDAVEGEIYQAERARLAEDEDGEQYRIVWRFPAVKGKEPEDHEWPWGNEKYIDRIERV